MFHFGTLCNTLDKENQIPDFEIGTLNRNFPRAILRKKVVIIFISTLTTFGLGNIFGQSNHRCQKGDNFIFRHYQITWHSFQNQLLFIFLLRLFKGKVS